MDENLIVFVLQTSTKSSAENFPGKDWRITNIINADRTDNSGKKTFLLPKKQPPPLSWNKPEGTAFITQVPVTRLWVVSQGKRLHFGNTSLKGSL